MEQPTLEMLYSQMQQMDRKLEALTEKLLGPE